MLSRKFNIIILLLCVLFVSAIKSSSNLVSSPNANPTILNLIVDSNKNNLYSSECGSSFEDSSDGTYSSEVNYIHSGLGLHITISTYTPDSNDVIIDGSDLINDLISFDSEGNNPPSSKTYLIVSNVAFVNFFSLDYHILHSDTNGKMETQYIFDTCKFLNSTNLRFSGRGESKEVNSISFENSIFENVTFREYSFFAKKFTTSFTFTKFNSVSFDDSFIVEEIDSKKKLNFCSFNQVSFGTKTQKLYFIEAKDISIEYSTFNQIIGPKSSTPASLLKISNSVNTLIMLNTFNNFDGVLAESNNSVISFSLNTFSNSNNKPIIKSLNSNVTYDSNIFKYSGNSNDQLIDCTGSSISFNLNKDGEIFEKNPICKDCFISIGPKTVCSKKTTTSSTTGDDDHPNGSVDGKSVSYQLLVIILIIISLLNIKIH